MTGLIAPILSPRGNGKLWVIGKLIFSLIVLVLIFHNIRFVEVLQVWASFHTSSLVVIAPIFLADRFIMSWKWTFLLRTLSIDLPQLSAFQIYYMSSFLGYLIPLGIGPDVVRFFKTRDKGYQSGTILVSIFAERFLGLAANILVLAFSSIFLLRLAFRVEQVLAIVIVTMILAAISVFLIFILFSEKSREYLSRHQLGRFRQVKEGFAEFEAGLARLREHRGALVLFTAVSFMENFLPIAMTYLTAKAVSLPLTLADCSAFVPFATFLQRLPFSFLGFGVREGSYAISFNFLGINAGRGVGLGALVFAIEIFVLLPAAFWLLVDQLPLKAGRGEQL